MTEIAINRCLRGTLLSDAGKAEYLKRKKITGDFDWTTLDRTDRVLIKMMREDMGKRVWGGECSKVSIVTVPNGMKWILQSQRGREWIAAEGSIA